MGMEHAPMVVHRISPSGGRRLTVRVEGDEQILGLARSDADVIEFLRRAGVEDPDELVLGGSKLARQSLRTGVTSRASSGGGPRPVERRAVPLATAHRTSLVRLLRFLGLTQCAIPGTSVCLSRLDLLTTLSDPCDHWHVDHHERSP
ncbi:hypothetical protein SLUN_21825 [Streptomyces lunaelactis]|uniref:Uncharacterized protein n=1 Tax=Streptomyces lunaelactis TaxID=1535768 RepID=A0A2R4T5I0_9ACTN|nr:hypothetical protein SLUN_21825 [Streptomyces lunaelactis]